MKIRIMANAYECMYVNEYIIDLCAQGVGLDGLLDCPQYNLLVPHTYDTKFTETRLAV